MQGQHPTTARTCTAQRGWQRWNGRPRGGVGYGGGRGGGAAPSHAACVRASHPRGPGPPGPAHPPEPPTAMASGVHHCRGQEGRGVSTGVAPCNSGPVPMLRMHARRHTNARQCCRATGLQQLRRRRSCASLYVLRCKCAARMFRPWRLQLACKTRQRLPLCACRHLPGNNRCVLSPCAATTSTTRLRAAAAEIRTTRLQRRGGGGDWMGCRWEGVDQRRGSAAGARGRSRLLQASAPAAPSACRCPRCSPVPKKRLSTFQGSEQ